jgi:hypothetical protein
MDVLTNTFNFMSNAPSTLYWKRRTRFEDFGFASEPMPEKIVSAKCYLALNETNRTLNSIPLQGAVKLVMDDEFKTFVGKAWGYRLVVWDDEIYAEMDLILEQHYLNIHGDSLDQKFIADDFQFENDESTEFQWIVVSKLFHQPEFSPFLPARICEIEDVPEVQNVFLKHSSKWKPYRNYHDWFAFFLKNRIEIFN